MGAELLGEIRQEAAAAPNPVPSAEALAVHQMSVLVRESLANAVRGRPDIDYVRAICRYRLAGVSVGDKYDSRQFTSAVEQLARVAVSSLMAGELASVLPGLGIPSDFALVFDGVSIGSTAFSRHETLLVTGAVFTSARTGGFRARMLAAPSMGFSHKGHTMRDLIFKTLQEHPLHFDMALLRARVGVVGGDGAVVRGGETARHQSSGAANLIWAHLHPNSELQAVDWDLFHRLDIVGHRAAKASPMAMEVHNVGRTLASLFGLWMKIIGSYRSNTAAQFPSD
jgi:hypothetical protein